MSGGCVDDTVLPSRIQRQEDSSKQSHATIRRGAFYFGSLLPRLSIASHRCKQQRLSKCACHQQISLIQPNTSAQRVCDIVSNTCKYFPPGMKHSTDRRTALYFRILLDTDEPTTACTGAVPHTDPWARRQCTSTPIEQRVQYLFWAFASMTFNFESSL